MTTCASQKTIGEKADEFLSQMQERFPDGYARLEEEIIKNAKNGSIKHFFYGGGRGPGFSVEDGINISEQFKIFLIIV